MGRSIAFAAVLAAAGALGTEVEDICESSKYGRVDEESFSLVQLYSSADVGRWRERRLLESESRGVEDNPVLQKRLADMLHLNGQDGNLTKTDDKQVAMQEPLREETNHIHKDEPQKAMEEAPAAPAAQEPPPPESLAQQSATLPEVPLALPPAQQPSPPEGREQLSGAPAAPAAQQPSEAWAQQPAPPPEAPQVEAGTATERAALAAAEKQHWDEVAREAQQKAAQAAKDEAKWEALAQEDVKAENTVGQRSDTTPAHKSEAKGEANQDAEAQAEVKQNAEAEATQKAESNANKEAVRTEAGTQQKAEEVIHAKTEAEAQALAEAEVRAKAKSDADAKQKAEDKAKLRAAANAEAEAQQKAEAAQKSLVKDKTEVESIVHSWEQARVCVRPEELNTVLEESKHSVLAGLPEWQEPEAPSELADITIAFLIQASWEEQLPVLRRTFDRLYTPKDLFLYTVDREKMDVNKVVDALPNPLPFNVAVKRSAHSDYFVWPRVEIVLDGLRTLLLNEAKWDFVIHLSESDYPVHSLNWIRQSLAAQRQTNFIQILPRCSKSTDRGLIMKQDDWYWWTQDDAMASCGSQSDVTTVDGVKFPLADFDQHGFRFAHGAEWMVITRELVKYALSPKLLPYRKLVGMHVGADEIFWQTLVLNIPKFGQKVSPQGWYIKWGHGKTDHSPDTLTRSYEDEIMRNRQNYFFIRKVSLTESPGLLDDIDRVNQGNDEAPGPVPTQTEDWSAGVVPCGSSYRRRGFVPRDVPMPPQNKKGWQGTKSRKQLLEAYKWYMQNQ